MRSPSRKKPRQELYPIQHSPLAQKLKQRDLAEMLRRTVEDLRREVNYKELAVVRRTSKTGRGKRAKVRDLVYPAKSSSLYDVHERLAVWLNRIKQPDYVFSPRAGKTTRANAAYHAGQKEFLQIDIRKFYPSTTKEMVRNGLIDAFGMYRDVANLIADLVTIDDRASFGSPVTPVLMTIVYRKMFDKIYEKCEARGLRMSVWVDDITISGKYITPELLEEVRGVIREYGHKSHKIRIRKYYEGICVTGVWLYGRSLQPDYSYEERLRKALEMLKEAESVDKREEASRVILSAAGSIRQISGPSSERGQQLANLMEDIRRKRRRWQKEDVGTATSKEPKIAAIANSDNTDIPF